MWAHVFVSSVISTVDRKEVGPNGTVGTSRIGLDRRLGTEDKLVAVNIGARIVATGGTMQVAARENSRGRKLAAHLKEPIWRLTTLHW
jgi:hypothetical protein